MNQILNVLSQVFEIYKSPFLVFFGHLEFTNFYNLLLLLIFIGAGAWFGTKAWRLITSIMQGQAIFDDVTKENLATMFPEVSRRFQYGEFAAAWHSFANTLVVRDVPTPSGENQKQIYATGDATQFFNEDNLIRINRGFLNALPGMFTGLGILGTFMGLIFGLQGISFGESTLIQQGMEQLLAGLLIAFSSSVWGITLSISFTSIEKWALNRIETEIIPLQDGINRVFPLITEEVYLSHLLEASREQSKILQNFSLELSDAVRQGINEGIGDGMASVVNQLTVATDKLTEFKQESTVEAVEHLIERFSEQLMGATQTQFDQLAEVVGHVADTMKGLGDDLQTHITQMTETSTQTVDALLHQTRTWMEDMEARLSDVANQRQVELNEISNVMQEARAIIAESNQTAQHFQQLATTLQQPIDGLQTVTDGFEQVAEKIEKTHEDYTRSVEQWLDHTDQQNSVSKHILEQTHHTVEMMQGLWENYEKQLVHLHQNIEAVLSKLQDGVMTYQMTVDQGLEGYVSVTKDSLGDYLKQVDEQLARSAQVLGDAISSLSKGVDEMKDAIQGNNRNGSQQAIERI
jgi:uncharacterized phage infection (PIP) family protein YhgE